MMMKFVSAIAFCLLLETVSAHDGEPFQTYQATSAPIPGVETTVAGTVVVFDTGDGTSVGYGGFVTGLQANLMSENCTAVNGCGAHIHEGTSCGNTSLPGGHYYTGDVDPWVNERYSSDKSGATSFSSLIEIGTNDLEGRAFVST